MPRIQAWKCPHTGALFEEERTYRNHLKQLSRERIAKRKWSKLQDSIIDVVKGAQRVASAQELVDYIIKHQKEFITFGIFNEFFDRGKLKEAMEKGYDIQFPRIRELRISTSWNDEVSNSHCCPRNGVTNWCRNKKDKPRGYPGWHGRIAMSYFSDNYHVTIKKPNKKTFAHIEGPSVSDMGSSFGSSGSLCGINTGGGTRNECSVSLFQDDFPVMAEAVTFALLKDIDRSGRFYELDQLGVGVYEIKE